MSLFNALLLIANPPAGWARLRDRSPGLLSVFLGHTAIFALIPALAAYYGTTTVGWRIGSGDVVRLEVGSAREITALYYLAMLGATCSVGWMTHWMSRTYGSSQSLARCLALASFAATPLFLFGAMQAYPVLWLNLVVGLPVLGYAVYLFYSGVPVMMEIEPERAFLFASAVQAYGLVTVVAMLAVTVILWGSGFAPVFVS